MSIRPDAPDAELPARKDDGRPATWPHRYVVGMRVDSTTYGEAAARILEWAGERVPRYVCVAAVNNAIHAMDDSAFMEAMNASDLTTSDGMPLVWALKRLGLPDATRVYGPTLTPLLWEEAARANVPIGLVGGSPEVLKTIVADLRRTLPDIEIAYAFSPPFQGFSAADERAMVADIAKSGARIVFVAYGCPRQELWMHEMSPHIPAVLVGVGAAFDFIARAKRQAPKWMQDHGLEWLFRLVMEPTRLWRRYLYGNPRFMLAFLRQLARENRKADHS